MQFLMIFFWSKHFTTAKLRKITENQLISVKKPTFMAQKKTHILHISYLSMQNCALL